MKVRIMPPEELPECTVEHLPLSKSVSARALILNAVASATRVGLLYGAAETERLSDCTDTHVMLRALQQRSGDIDVADCGTAARFLTAFFAASNGSEVTLSGTPRMHKRPIGPLVDALRALGADIRYGDAEGCLPLCIRGKRLAGGNVCLDAGTSSQFASALAMVAPLMDKPLRIDLGGEIPSLSYLKMTLKMLNNRGNDAFIDGYSVVIPNSPLDPIDYESEADWSAAAFWYELAAVTSGFFTLKGLHHSDLQGDCILEKIGERFGVITDFCAEGAEISPSPDLFSRLDLDMKDNLDLVPPLAVTCALLRIPFRFCGVTNLRYKESDRIAALSQELARCGIILNSDLPDRLDWEGEIQPISTLPAFDAHNDHRLAMALAPFATVFPRITISGAECVAKSYPRFWDDLQAAGFAVEQQ